MEEPEKLIEQLNRAQSMRQKYAQEDKAFSSRISNLILLFSLVLVVVLCYLYFNYSGEGKKELISTAVTLAVSLIGLLISYYAVSKSSNENNAELGEIINERKEINNKIEQKEEPSIFDTLRLNLNHVSEYYTINKSQAKNSFIVSLFAATFGFVIIVVGIVLFYVDSRKNINISFLTGIAGILLEFIGGAYFFMYKKSLEQVNFFFGQLIKVQDTMLAISLAENIEEPRKSEAKDKIIASLLERSLK